MGGIVWGPGKRSSVSECGRLRISDPADAGPAGGAVVSIARSAVAGRQSPGRGHPADLLSGDAGPGALAIPLAGRDTSRRVAGPSGGRPLTTLLQHCWRLYRMRNRDGGCGVSLYGLLVCLRPSLVRHPLCLRHCPVAELPGLAEGPRREAGAEAARPA